MPIYLYALLTWTTRQRAPTITRDVATFLERTLPSIARRYGVSVLELGIVSDHVHMLVNLPTRIDFPRLVQGLKGASARIANRDGVARREPLRWANGYDLRTIGVGGLARASEYVRGQAERHSGCRVPG